MRDDAQREKHRQYMRQWRATHPEQCAAYRRKAYARDPQKSLNATRSWKTRNPEKVRDWRIRNKERIAASARRGRVVHRDVLRARVYAWRRQHPERVNDLSRKSRARHPETARAGSQRRRARNRGASGKWREGDIHQLLIAQFGLCALCGKPLGPDFHRDHITPLAKGGSNWPSNIQLTHGHCNQMKGARCVASV